MPLDDIREKIDEIDFQLITILKERASAASDDLAHRSVDDATRAKLIGFSDGRLPEESIFYIYREIVGAGLALVDEAQLRRFVELLNERADCVHVVGEIKKKEGLQIYAPEREESLLRKLSSMSDGVIEEKSIRAIYREIMSAALALEDDLKIAYLGPEGTWTHQAAISKFGHSVTYLPQANFADVFDCVDRKEASYGVVPIENSTEGAVSHTLDLFVESPLKICAQILMRIENGLMASIDKSEIKTLYSHPQVFGQCRNWILENMPHADLVEVSSTTKAANIAKDKANEGAAAMGGPLAAEMYGLKMLESGVQDNSNNTTRFLVIGQKTCPPTGDDRTSLLFAIKDQPGSLVKALKTFEEQDINMSKIESRPSKQRVWEYYFYVDISAHAESDNVIRALENLQDHCSMIKILGSYQEIKHSNKTN
ncbi:prephenate dehydratase [Rubritalea tangerina]|uniref:Bifunctional chorismate mutase/prephenate dehydratase n=1 Tax=Rubritalea tangerina TaxID=430798 RepID=A0ABW4Z8A2_9BACT